MIWEVFFSAFAGIWIALSLFSAPAIIAMTIDDYKSNGFLDGSALFIAMVYFIIAPFMIAWDAIQN